VNRRQVFVDLDGVLADFDGFYASQFGITPDRDAPEPPGFWKRIDDHGRFFRDMPPLPDAMRLWDGVKLYHPEPIILTGIPLTPGAEEQKREWVAEHIQSDARVICCRSKDKRNYGRPGDILIDDWKKYRHLWEEMGGVFILHISVDTSLFDLERELSGLA
jgi:5'(3')-deoxyribonucleotidase